MSDVMQSRWFPPIYRGHVISIDDLIDTLTRVAALADSANYALRRGNHIALEERFEQIKNEALEAIERAERGEV